MMTGDTVTAKPLKKGRALLESGFIESIQDSMSPKGGYVLRAHVHHSIKNLLLLNVTGIISSTSGNLKNCTCSCKASASGRCAHVSALLLHLDEYVKSNGCVVQSPSTSKPCEWNKGEKRQKNPKPLHKVSL